MTTDNRTDPFPKSREKYVSTLCFLGCVFQQDFEDLLSWSYIDENSEKRTRWLRGWA